MWQRIEELNAASASLGGAPWFYSGDVDIREGGIAVRVNRSFLWADVVESVDLGSATGQNGVAMIEANSVSLGGSLSDRRRLRSAMETCGLTMADLIQCYPDHAGRWQRWAELARALYIYGHRDEGRIEIVAHDPDSDDQNDVRGGGFEIDGRVDGETELEDLFLGYLV